MNTIVTTTARTRHILATMRVVAWIVFIWLMVETGMYLVTYIISCINPPILARMYRGMEYYDLMMYDFLHYSLASICRIAYTGLITWTAYQTVSVLSAVNLETPFTFAIARLLEKISTTLLITSLVAIAINEHAGWLSHYAGIHHEEVAVDGLLATAGLVFIISQIFRRGVEIQSEHDLTI